jgi:glucose/arabinose dehydrogenase
VAAAVLIAGCSTDPPAADPADDEPALADAPDEERRQTPAEEPPPAGPAADDAPTEEADAADEEPAEPLDPLLGLEVEIVAEGFNQAVGVVTAPDDDRLFVVLRGGQVRVVQPDGTVEDTPLLDVGDRITTGSIEQGLLGFVFHPDHPRDPRVFAYYSVPSNDTHLVSFEVSDDGTQVDPDTAEVLLEIDRHPERVRHNGGMLRFGPDGYLWAAIGDGAQASVNGQDPNTLLGALLRLDVDGGQPYAIPPDNPFVDGGGAPEVYHYGLRNPWRFTFDDGLLYIADVGQETVEEINIVPIEEAGGNFGWPVFEGTLEFYGGEPHSPVTPPVRELFHEDGHCSLTGGEVYRGTAIPELDGHYFHADWCRGLVESFRFDGAELSDIADWTDALDVAQPSSFGVDPDGELLIVDWGASALLRVVPIR